MPTKPTTIDSFSGSQPTSEKGKLSMGKAKMKMLEKEECKNGKCTPPYLPNKSESLVKGQVGGRSGKASVTVGKK